MKSLTPTQRTRKAARPTPGFTLLELLLATAIFSIVLLSINTVFFASLRLRKSVTEQLDKAVPMEHALTILRRDLQNAIPPGEHLAGHFRSTGPASTTGTNTSSGTATAGGPTGGISSGAQPGANLRAGTFGQGGGLDFFTSTGALRESTPFADLQEVNYQLMPPEDNNAAGKELVRSVTRNLLSYVATPELQVLASNIDDMAIEFYDGTEWRDDWDTTMGDTALPQAVRVRLYPVAERTTTLRQEPVELLVRLSTGTGSSTMSDTNSTGGMQ